MESQLYGASTGICMECGLSTEQERLEPGPQRQTPFGSSQFWRCRNRGACAEMQRRNAEVKEVESAKLDSRIPRGMMPRYSKRKGEKRA